MFSLVLKSLITCLISNNNSISVTVSVITGILSASNVARNSLQAGTVHSLPLYVGSLFNYKLIMAFSFFKKKYISVYD